MKNNKKVIIILALVILLGAFLRFYKLGDVSFVADEFLDINATYGYAKTGEWQAWDFNLGQPAERVNVASDERAWLYRWQVAQVFKFFPPTEAVARSVSAVWGVLSILIIFFVARDFTKKNEIGILGAFLFAVSVSGIILDRRLRMYAMFFPVFLMFSWALYKFLEKKYSGKMPLCGWVSDKWGINLMYAFPALIFGGLSFQLHQLAGTIIPVAGVYILIQAFLARKKSGINKYSALLILGLAGAAFVWILKPALIQKFLGGLVFFENHWSYVAIAFNDYSLIVAALAALAIGIYYLAKKEKLVDETLWLSLSFFIPFLMAIFFWQRNVGEQYLFFAKSFLIILVAAGIFAVADFLRRNLVQAGKKYYAAAIVAFAVLLPNHAYFFAENNAYRQTSASENPNYRSIFTYFKKNRLSGDVLVTRDFRNYYWSGEKVKTFDFGGELSKENFTLNDLQKIMAENPSGWFIYSGNDEDYIFNETEKYAAENLEKINAIAVRGDVSVYRWRSVRTDQ